MVLEGLPSPVGVIAADFAFILNSESMEFIQPVRNGLSIPSERQILGVVNWLVIVGILLLIIILG